MEVISNGNQWESLEKVMAAPPEEKNTYVGALLGCLKVTGFWKGMNTIDKVAFVEVLHIVRSLIIKAPDDWKLSPSNEKWLRNPSILDPLIHPAMNSNIAFEEFVEIEKEIMKEDNGIRWSQPVEWALGNPYLSTILCT